MKGSRLWVYLPLGVIALCVFVVVAGFLYSAYASPASRAAAPYVEITGTGPQGASPVGQPVVVFAEAHDPAGITRAELWVNGAKTATQDNPDPSPQLPFEISSAWIPTGAGRNSSRWMRRGSKTPPLTPPLKGKGKTRRKMKMLAGKAPAASSFFSEEAPMRMWRGGGDARLRLIIDAMVDPGPHGQAGMNPVYFAA